MSNSENEKSITKVHDFIVPKAELCKTILQMIIGTVLIGLIIYKLYLMIWPSSEIIWSEFSKLHPLEITGYALAVSASIELAYMLFTPGPDEAIDPLILGFSASALIEISKPEIAKFEVVVLIAVLTASIGFLFWVKQNFTKIK